MSPEEVEALAQRVAAILAAPQVAPPCGCHVQAAPASASLDDEFADMLETILPEVGITAPVDQAAVAQAVTAAVAQLYDAPASMAPEDGLSPLPQWESQFLELKSTVAALRERMDAIESDIATAIIERTDLQFLP